MAALVVVIIALGTLAFGAVYPWGFIPLFAIAAAIGGAGLTRAGVCTPMRPVAAALLLLCVAAAAQLVPLPSRLLDWLSPSTAGLLSRYDLVFAGGSAWAPLSINPRSTRTAVFALCALTLYLVGLPALLHGRSVRALPTTLAIFAVPLALFGIYTWEYNNGLMYWFWETQDVPYALGGGTNQFGPFVNRNHFGGWMLMTVCLLIGALFARLERVTPERRTRPQWRLERLGSAEATGLLMMIAAVLVAVMSLVWTMSRSAMVGFAAAAAAFAWLAVRRRRLGMKRRTAAVAALAAAVIAAVAWRGPAALFAWFQNERDLLGRFATWRDGTQIIRDFPVSGTGLNTFSDAMLFYQSGNTGFHMAQAHNDYVQLAAEGGLLVGIPAAAAAILLGRAIRLNLRAARAESRGYWIRAGAAIGLLAIATQEVFEFSLQIPANAFLFATLAAVALAPVGFHPPPAPEPRDTIHPGLPRTISGVSLS
jgi:O-antigen ligase